MIYMNSTELFRLVLNLIRKGTISAVDHNAEMCRVSTGALETDWIRWMAAAAGTTRAWNPPTVGEHVLLFCPGGDPASGVALRGLYANSAPAPSHNANCNTRAYPDGAVIQYDHAQHVLSATFPQGGIVRITAPDSVNVTTTILNVNGDARVTGDVAVDGDVSVQGEVSVEGNVEVASNVNVDGSVHVGNGASGTFTTVSKHMVTVVDGIVTQIIKF